MDLDLSCFFLSITFFLLVYRSSLFDFSAAAASNEDDLSFFFTDGSYCYLFGNMATISASS
jgi:hypothetical protein